MFLVTIWGSTKVFLNRGVLLLSQCKISLMLTPDTAGTFGEGSGEKSMQMCLQIVNCDSEFLYIHNYIIIITVCIHSTSYIPSGQLALLSTITLVVSPTGISSGTDR